MAAKTEQLQQELADLERLIEEAAVYDDVSEWIRLAMRRDALPALIREARTAPVRQKIERLEEELAELDEELKRAQEGPLPSVPAGRFGITPLMMKNQQIDGIAARSSNLSRELKQAQRELAEIEADGQGGR